LDDFNAAVDYLESEDPESNSRAENGRRIIPLSEIDTLDDNRGWLIVNYAEYRQRATKHDTREATAERVKRYRERQKSNDDVTGCNGMKRTRNGKKGHTDTDTDTDIKKKKKKKKKAEHNESTKEIFQHYIDIVDPPKQHIKKQAALNNISKWEKEFSAEDLKAAAENYSTVKTSDHQYVKGPSNFYGRAGENERFFYDYLPGQFDPTYTIETDEAEEYPVGTYGD
jgi:hypothetical protein